MAELEKEQTPSTSEASSAPAAASLIEEICLAGKVKATDEGYPEIVRGIRTLVDQIRRPEYKTEQVDKSAVDRMIAEIDQKLSRQMDAILHHEAFQEMESSWRGLKLLIDRTDFRENIRVEVLNISKDDLIEDFADAGEIPDSGLYKAVYTAEYGQFGGEPYGAMIANYHLGPGPRDVDLMKNVAAVGAMAHAPFIAAAGPQFFNLESFEGLPNLNDIDEIIRDSKKHAKWRSFRESDDSRAVGLTMPRFLLRLPYHEEDNPVRGKSFNYNEEVSDSHESYLWGNTAFAFASRITESFAKYRWCPNIIGPDAGGTVHDLPLHVYESMGKEETKIPTEVLISERRDVELQEQGFIALTMRKGSDNACFFSANTAQKPKYFGTSAKGKQAELNYKLSTQLPYMFVVNRLAHYIKVLQRERIGASMTAPQLEKELTEWLEQYVLRQDVVEDESIRARKPLRDAELSVEDVEGEPGWYKIQMNVRPHFKYMGAFFELSLVGRLDRDKKQ